MRNFTQSLGWALWTFLLALPLACSDEGPGAPAAGRRRPGTPQGAPGAEGGSEVIPPPPGGPSASDVDAGRVGRTETCVARQLKFSADSLPAVPAAGSALVWGGNATGGDNVLYSAGFLASAKTAHERKLPVFAYLEGPCGDTGGVDDGERARCAAIHNGFNQKNAPQTPNTPLERWKPFTMKQLTESAVANVDYCEIDNLDNNVTVPLNALAREIKTLFDAGQIHCRFVLKNVPVADIDSLREEVAPTVAAANFIAPFHIFEATNANRKAALDAAMVRLKGPGATTIISTDTNAYGSAFTNDKFSACDTL